MDLAFVVFGLCVSKQKFREVFTIETRSIFRYGWFSSNDGGDGGQPIDDVLRFQHWLADPQSLRLLQYDTNCASAFKFTCLLVQIV